jgi:PEP-CTERM/exosortase A-associated glycosyltransferase
MRILHILDHSIPLHSGYVFRTLGILKEQRALGWDTFHLTSPKQGQTPLDEEQMDGWHFYRTRMSHGRFQAIPGLAQVELMHAMSSRIEQIAKTVRPDILHAHSPVLNAIPTLAVGRRLRIPVVYEVRASWEDAAVDHGTARAGGARYRLSRALETWALRRADAVTTICDGLRNEIVARGIPGDKVTVIPNAVDIEAFSEGGMPDPKLKEQLGLEGALVLGFIGSFYAYEGLAVLLQAIPQLRKKVGALRVLLVGGGRQEPELKRLVAELGIQEQVVFTGRVPHEQTQRYYNLIDVLIYPRLSMRLTELVTPLKPLEAMAQGRLLLASDVGGHRELICPGETGTLFKAGDPEALAAAVLDLVGHPERWPQVKLNARRFVENERNWRASVARYRSVYGALAKGNSRSFVGAGDAPIRMPRR